MEYQINLKDIKERIFKTEDGWNNYMHISIEEMDWLVEQSEKVERYKKVLEQIAFNDQLDVSETARTIVKKALNE